MNKKEQIKAYWERMDKLGIKIKHLANTGQSFHIEQTKWKSMYNNVKRLLKEQVEDKI